MVRRFAKLPVAVNLILNGLRALLTCSLRLDPLNQPTNLSLTSDSLHANLQRHFEHDRRPAAVLQKISRELRKSTIDWSALRCTSLVLRSDKIAVLGKHVRSYQQEFGD